MYKSVFIQRLLGKHRPESSGKPVGKHHRPIASENHSESIQI